MINTAAGQARRDLTDQRTMSDNRTPLRPDVPDDIEESLKEIIDYLWDDEFRHFRAFGGNFHSHIFTHLVTVRRWLEGDDK